jgi:hypothetical protein
MENGILYELLEEQLKTNHEDIARLQSELLGTVFNLGLVVEPKILHIKFVQNVLEGLPLILPHNVL